MWNPENVLTLNEVKAHICEESERFGLFPKFDHIIYILVVLLPTECDGIYNFIHITIR